MRLVGLFLCLCVLLPHCYAEIYYAGLTWRRTGTRVQGGHPEATPRGHWQHMEGEPTTVDFILTLSVHMETVPSVGELYPLEDEFYLGDGNLLDVNPIVTQVIPDPEYADYFVVELTMAYAYVEPAIYRAGINICCRRTGLNNNALTMLKLSTTLNLLERTSNTTAPIVKAPPVIPVLVDESQSDPATFQLKAINPNPGLLNWRVSTVDESGGLPPTGLTVSGSGGTGTFTWSGAGSLSEGLYSAQVAVETADQDRAVMDLVFDLRWRKKVCDPSCLNGGTACSSTADCTSCTNLRCMANSGPVFESPSPTMGSIIEAEPCEGVTLQFYATDADVSDTITIVPNAMPTGMLLASDEGGNPRQQIYTWNPTHLDSGYHPICFLAWDNLGMPSDPLCFHIAVSYDPCSSHGQCVSGQCVCNGNWGGSKCETCLPGFEGEECSIKFGGPVYGFGSNSQGQLGVSGGGAMQTTPTRITEAIDGLIVTSIAAGASHTLVLTSEHRVFSFGNNDQGQLGYASNYSVSSSSIPLEITSGFGTWPPFHNVTILCAGTSHSMALTEDHRVYTWGSNTNGQLGRNESESGLTFPDWNSSIPVDITEEISDFVVFIAAGGDFSYALTNTSRIFAWGANANGQLGTGDQTDREHPTEVTAQFPEAIVSIAAGKDHILALSATGHVYAVGSNSDGQLGLNSVAANTATPTLMDSSFYDAEEVTAIGAGYDHSFIQANTSRILAFGANDYGQLGTGNHSSYNYPFQIRLDYYNGDYNISKVTKFALGRKFSLIFTDDYRVYGVGSNENGQLGDNSTVDRLVAVRISDTFNGGVPVDIAAGDDSSLIILRNENFDPGHTLFTCFPLVAGYPTQCKIELFDTRGDPWGGAEQLPNFKIENIRGGDGREICPPPADAPTYLDQGRYIYTWTSPSLGRGGRFKVSFMGIPLYVQNNTHNEKFLDMATEVHGYDPRNPMKTPEYVQRAREGLATMEESQLYLFFEASDTYDQYGVGSELIVNGGAESGLTGWTVEEGSWGQRSTDPHAEWDSFYFGPLEENATLTQTVDVTSLLATIDGNLQVFYFRAYVRTVDEADVDDTSRVLIEYFNDTSTNHTPLTTFDSGYITSHTSWQRVTDIRTAPAGTRAIRVTLEAKGYGGDAAKSYFDSISLIPGDEALNTDGVEKAALQDLYTDLGGASWTNNANWNNGDPCIHFWVGITCRYHRVIKIELPFNNLQGTIPQSIGNFPFLLELDLSGNQLTGTVPTELVQLLQLQRLKLNANGLTNIPDTMSSLVCLKHLSVADNQLTAIPSTLGAMFRIKEIDLSNNVITNSIPDLTTLSLLRSLRLQRNQISGTIPTNIGTDLASLRTLDLSHNNLVSEIPLSFGNFNLLHSLFLNHNYLYGEIPSNMASLPLLSQLQAHFQYNALTGEVPTWVLSAKMVYLASNNFTCPIPQGPSIYDSQYLTCHEFEVDITKQTLSFEKTKTHDEL